MNSGKKTIFILLSSIVLSTTIQDVYNDAMPLNGYDKYLILDSSIIYTGGLGVFEGDVYIEGNGATINLYESGGLWAFADEEFPASLSIEYCSIINSSFDGGFGMSYSGTATGIIKNCNFVNNHMGIKLFDNADVEIINCNFVNNLVYGVGLYGSELVETPISYSNVWNNGEEDYMENCPGWGNIWTPLDLSEAPGLINQNPQFVDINANNFNYIESSPCIDNGSPNLSDPDQTRSDIGGQFFNQGNSCDEIIKGDINQDNVINVLDVITLVNYFFGEEIISDCISIISDLNNDGITNILDIVQLVSLILNQT